MALDMFENPNLEIKKISATKSAIQHHSPIDMGGNPTTGAMGQSLVPEFPQVAIVPTKNNGTLFVT